MDIGFNISELVALDLGEFLTIDSYDVPMENDTDAAAAAAAAAASAAGEEQKEDDGSPKSPLPAAIVLASAEDKAELFKSTNFQSQQDCSHTKKNRRFFMFQH